MHVVTPWIARGEISEMYVTQRQLKAPSEEVCIGRSGELKGNTKEGIEKVDVDSPATSTIWAAIAPASYANH
jgi:hypothetical protein